MPEPYLFPDILQSDWENAPLGKAAKKPIHDNDDKLPENLGKAIKLTTPDFSDPNRKPSCLEVDFPIAHINEISKIESASGPARKRIYCMSKWWARRASSVFRSLLIAAATQAPSDEGKAAKLVWDHYYCNHQKAESFKKLKVLDCFMGGGTTLVEGSRLGMQMTGVDLNPVAWFVVKNELACSDPEQVSLFFQEIEKQVKPQVQPFYTTTCPRGHKGRWIDTHTNEATDVHPEELPPEQRNHYRWEGPELIYTFWAKHGQCHTPSGDSVCGHRTPVFSSPVIAEKNLSPFYIELTCPHCGKIFHAELGETRMAPGIERVISGDETPFTEIAQNAAKMLQDFDHGAKDDKTARAAALKSLIHEGTGFACPDCGTFAGKRINELLENIVRGAVKPSKKDLNIKRKAVRMYLLIHPDWLKGASGFDGNGNELGGYAGAPAGQTGEWYEKRLNNLRLIEFRGENLPETITLADGTILDTRHGSAPRKAHVTCTLCGRENNMLEMTKASGHTAPVAAYALQCHCPQCEAEGYNYGGRYFKMPDEYDAALLKKSEEEWEERAEKDLAEFWPRQQCWDAYMMRANGGVNEGWGYTHWWKMFNPRQLLVHTLLLKDITELGEWPLDIREQCLGAWQEYSRHNSMFCFWDIQQDCLAPMLANANFHPKNVVVENNVWMKIGRANWHSCLNGVIDGMKWAKCPTELILNNKEGSKSKKIETGDPIITGMQTFSFSSTDLSKLSVPLFDLIITDPPFGNNLFYADLADFFYVWLRLPLRKWYAGLPEASYFEHERTPHSIEAVDNPVEHPDDREEHEKQAYISEKHLARIRGISGDSSLKEKDRNPLYRPEPSGDFYSQTLQAVWAEAGRRLKDAGIMAFTFHHNEDNAWIDVLEALFKAGYILVATYPIRSDETKGESAAFGSRKIEYDIIHVCRKRLEEPAPVAWAKMRRWVKDESARLKALLEHTHGKSMTEADLRVILRGKSLEYYSRHYGKVFTGEDQMLDVRHALLGINQLLDELIEDSRDSGPRPPENAEPLTRQFLRLFGSTTEIARDDLHKTLKGSGVSSDELVSKGWVKEIGRTFYAKPIAERFAYFTSPHITRKVLKTDLDQAHFLIGAAYDGSQYNITSELNNPNFKIKKPVDDILRWYSRMPAGDSATSRAAKNALTLVESWRASKKKPDIAEQSLFDMLEEEIYYEANIER
jgi:adenine-specific DNA methylase